MPGQQFQKGGATQADDITLTDEDRDAAIRWYHALVEDRAHNGKLHYSPIPVAGALPGSFRIPKEVFSALGHGDLKLGGAVVHAMFGLEDNPSRVDLIHPHAVRILGNGSLAKGRKVLERFVQMVRRQGAQQHIEQPDGNHGRVINGRL